MSKTLLQINVTANWGSTGKIAEQIGICAMSNGWKSYIAYGRMMNPSQLHLIKVGSKINTYIHYASNLFLDKEGLSSTYATKKLINVIKTIEPDVIQLHNIHDHWLNYEVLFNYLNNSKIKVFWTFHDCWAFTGHCHHFVDINCTKWIKGCSNCPKRNFFADRSFINYNLKKQLFTNCLNLTIIPVSNWMENFVSLSFLKNKPRITIHNGIDLSVFKPNSDVEKSTSIFNIIAVSSVWTKSKGIDDIFKLRELLSSEYHITIVGLNEKQISNLPKGINGIQRTQNLEALVKLYSTSDVFINPTYADTFPTVNLEALACGTPVITYKTGGSPEAVDEKTGIVVEQGNVNALADAIVKIRKHPLSSKDCRMRAIERFDKDMCFNKYIQLYERVSFPEKS